VHLVHELKLVEIRGRMVHELKLVEIWFQQKKPGDVEVQCPEK
jgi:hypothetical protein